LHDCPEVVWLPKGELFLDQPNAATGPRYAVKMSYLLAVGRFKVSVAEWEACVADRGCRRRTDNVAWGARPRSRDQRQLGGRTAVRHLALAQDRQALPAADRAEWEYAARTGNDVYDMHAGVSEWVENCYQHRDLRTGNGGWLLECTNQTLRGAPRGMPPAETASPVFRPVNYQDGRIGFRIARTE
jgi:formylglycine-generating enzyme required for sulfatase activity